MFFTNLINSVEQVTRLLPIELIQSGELAFGSYNGGYVISPLISKTKDTFVSETRWIWGLYSTIEHNLFLYFNVKK